MNVCYILNDFSSRSPRWLAKKKQYAKAYRVLCGLRATPLQAASKCISNCNGVLTDRRAGDLYYIYAQLRVETLLFSTDPDIERHLENWDDQTLYEREAEASTYGRRFLQLFTVYRNGRASLAAAIVMASQYVGVYLQLNSHTKL